MSEDSSKSASTGAASGEWEARCVCGTSRADLYTHGLMGCPQCYEYFHAEVKRALEEIHGAVRHIGKG